VDEVGDPQGLLSALGAISPDLLGILGMSAIVSGVAILIAMALGVPVGIFLGLHRFPGRKLVVTVINTGMGLPPVVVGLAVFLLLSRAGPFGAAELLYTPSAMILAQVMIATPLVAGVTLAAIQGLDERLRLLVLSLGASRWQLYLKLAREARLSLVAALAAGLGSIISEVGAVMMVGGNIRGDTRVMTTAIVLETRQGNFALAVALSVLLLVIALLLNWVLTWVQQRGRP
jgi:tungstate transport system permease protein